MAGSARAEVLRNKAAVVVEVESLATGKEDHLDEEAEVRVVGISELVVCSYNCFGSSYRATN